jgi:protein tyrosine/serine phosphatase
VFLNAKSTRRHTAGLVLALLLTAPAFAGPSTASSATEKIVDLSTITISNFGRINENYYRGAQPRGRDFASLAALGVKTVIDLTKDGNQAEPGLVQAAGMRFFRIPMTTHEPPSPSTIEYFLQLVDDPANQPVYVHCQGGRHRTGIMTAVYRMTVDGWTAARAFAEMKQFRFGADYLHPEFKRFVHEYRPPAAVAPVVPARSGS